MLVCDIDRQRLDKLASKLCEHRNQGLPIEHGKAHFEVLESGVLFTKSFFKLDSGHPDYSKDVAKVEFDPDEHTWQLFVNKRQKESLSKVWHPHPVVPHSRDLSQVFSVIESDQENCIWY
ncbi:hypothetical protein CW749_21575 [Vibrio sp. vnigr-6D03]|uniref:DUF3024 domain-containing protein n=1 Tax=Vibrio sp. vnigr-6D03 TaxID=2058088 RepID=UPI000C33B4C1|nr:DUF3024 domain-containing protein [Vibrio sp. vnigr-6D03]PKF77674.1 hypothetical protein CW749_21575 [Vibrio sp. vnigr-6D03]